MTRIHQVVDAHLTIGFVNTIVAHVQTLSPRWWGKTKPPKFDEWMIYATLYKALKNCGYAELRDELKRSKIKLSQKSVTHNVQVR